MKKTYKIEGMSCGHCKASVETGIKNVQGVNSVSVDLGKKTATVEGIFSPEEIEGIVNKLGFVFVGEERDI